MIRKLVKSPDRVHFLHYGKHTATNEYALIKHVFLAGILQYNTAQYVATALAAKGAPKDQKLSAEELLSIRYGEIAHHILQAACRGYVRNCIGDTCPPDCHLYIVFPTMKGAGIPRELMTDIFPSAAIEDWRPIVNVKGKPLELFNALMKDQNRNGHPEGRSPA